MASPEEQHLRTKLAITPKTASLLYRVGYKDYRDLRHVSPNKVSAQLKELPAVTASQAETYKRGLRRMVWLATKEDPEDQAKLYPDWTQKALVSRGWWVEGYDDLTGDDVEKHMTRTQDTSN